MENISADILNFHCPRWHEFPDIDLYMDQLVTILEKNLIVFEQIWGEKIITSTMINNYVKQKVVVPRSKNVITESTLLIFLSFQL